MLGDAGGMLGDAELPSLGTGASPQSLAASPGAGG